MIRHPRMILPLSLFIILLSSLNLLATDRDSLRFSKSDKHYHVLEFEMAENLYKRVQLTKGEKLVLEKTALKFNGEPVSIDEVHLHGNTTLYYDRKSFSVDASEKIKLCKKGCKPLEAFYLLSLSMDRNYFHNRLCFDLLNHLDLFHLQYSFAELKINGESQGIYLILQRPQDWSIKTVNSPSIIRRGSNHRIDKVKYEKDMEKATAKEYRQQFLSIYKLIYKYSGEDLYKRLNEIMHVEDYLRWLAFNYVIKNGDYSDELYFYIDPETKRFRIIPWDYDDVFKAEPHEGLQARKNRMDPLCMIFSSEDDLDLKIAHDPFLYDQYLRCLKSVIQELNMEKVESVMKKLYEDLSPLVASGSIVKAASKDGYETSIQQLQIDLLNVYQYFDNLNLIIKKSVVEK